MLGFAWSEEEEKIWKPGVQRGRTEARALAAYTSIMGPPEHYVVCYALKTI